MFAPRLRAARDRGLDHVLRRLLPSGGLGPDVDDPAAYHRAPYALATAGHLAAAGRVLDRAARRYVTADGDVRASGELRSADAGCAASPSRMPSFLALGALRAGRVALGLALAKRLDALRTPSGGALAGDGDDGATDLASTLRVANVDLALGRVPEALRAAEWVASLWDAQAHPDVFLLRRDGGGALVTLWPAGSPVCHAIHARGPGSGHGLLGEALTFLANALGLADGAAAARLRATAAELGGFAVRCAEHARQPDDAAGLARGAAALARALGAGADPELADLAVSLALRAAESWLPEGAYPPAYDDEPAASRLDRVVWVSACLHETLAALDRVEPVRELPAPSPGWRVVLCNVPEVKAQEMADALVSERLAACVNALGPVKSTYEWKGELQRDHEVTLLIKTTAERVPALTARVRALHPYELPEVIALAVEPREGHAPYLDWVRAQVSPEERPPPPPESA